MKVFKILGIILSTFFFVSLSAQETATTRLTIGIQPIQSIRINEAQQEISLYMNTIQDFTEGKESLLTDHVEIMSNMKYEVRVMAQDDLKNNNDRIDIGLVELTPSFGNVGNADSRLQFHSVVLSQQEYQLIISQIGDIKRTFSMNYRLKSSDEWLNKTAGSYSAVILYTILSL